MHVNEKNIIIKDIFSKSEIEQIYEHVALTPEEQKYLVEDFGHVAHFSGLPDNIVQKITSIVKSIYGEKIKLEEFCYARYSRERGAKPQLLPHYDDTFEEPRLTIDIQLKSSKPWAIVVEGSSYTLQDNQALTFSGTHQVHWREKIAFSENDFVDMIFCHFREVSDNKNVIEPTHFSFMDEKIKKWKVTYDLLPDPYVI
jgi:hypothetical protein